MLWLGGYPKSGTTWLKFIVAALLYRTNNPKQIEKLIPTITKKKKVPNGIYKIHFCKPPKRGKKILIVRHPVDICVSGINYSMLRTGSLILGKEKITINKYVNRFIKTKGNILRNVHGRWETHIRAWTKDSRCLWVRYEDLLNDTREKIVEIADFINVDYKNIDYAIEGTSFKEMRRLEKKGVVGKKNIPEVFYNPKHKGYKKGLMFMNRGKRGYAGEVLAQKQINTICQAFKIGMELLGYEDYESIS